MQFETGKFENIFFRSIMGACVLAMLTVMGVYAYLGTFSRYLSDDYCEAVRVNHTNPLDAVIDRYTDGQWRAANRYSNLMFVGFGEWLGENNLPLVTVLMVLLWPLGLAWGVYEFRKFFKVTWPIQVDVFLGLTLGFFILLQAPNLFQTIYWRSSMMTHFAPLVFGSFLFAFWMKQAAHALYGKTSLAVYFVIFFATYIISGFSEPPVATMVTALSLLIFAVVIWASPLVKRNILPLLLCAFAGAFLGLLTMVFSPANMHMTGQDTPGVFDVLRDSFLFSYIFVIYAFKVLPLPNLLSALIPALLVWMYKQNHPWVLSAPQKRMVWIMIAVSPVVMWIMIAAGFSPSVYGQGYPVERMRFLACSLMTATFMFEGALAGLLLGDFRFGASRTFIQWAALALFVLAGFLYPIRAAVHVYRNTLPEYRTRAEMWDLRDAYIIRHASLGETEIVVPGYSAAHSIKELDDNPDHWVNRCAAGFYGVQSIRAVNIPDEYILEYLSD
jgi:hypothetical protein